METLQGVVSNCQHTLRVSGGGSNNHTASTSYIALFRVNSRPVEFRTPRPNSVSDGDQVVVAGLPIRSGALRAYACRNVSTGEVTNSGFWGYVIVLIVLPIICGVFTLIGTLMFAKYGFLIGIVLVLIGMVFLIRQIVVIHRAMTLVQA